MTEHAAMMDAPEQAMQAAASVLRLRDGTIVQVRPIRPDDTARLRALHARLSPESIIFRFFHFLPELSQEDAEHFTHVDYVARMALVATIEEGDDERIIGVVRYDRIGDVADGEAEAAFVVEDRWQGHGIATALLHRLAAHAREHGIRTLVAVTMANNARMLDVLRNAGFPVTMRYNRGDIEARLDITKSPHTTFA